ncbi:hypothetical protein BH20VER1_BH20VER1_28260 [soil metagenome]
MEFTVDAFPTRTFRGKVVQVRNAPITVQNVVTYDTVIAVSNPDQKLKPGMTANVSIISAHRDGVLQIPNGALRVRLPDLTPSPSPPSSTTASGESAASGESPAAGAERKGRGRGRGEGAGGGGRRERRAERTVYVMSGNAGKPTTVSIKAGISDGVATEVTEGVQEGDRVVTGVTENAKAARTPANNPFSGGGQRGRGGRGF